MSRSKNRDFAKRDWRNRGCSHEGHGCDYCSPRTRHDRKQRDKIEEDLALDSVVRREVENYVQCAEESEEERKAADDYLYPEEDFYDWDDRDDWEVD